jgi:hypothetical protein
MIDSGAATSMGGSCLKVKKSGRQELKTAKMPDLLIQEVERPLLQDIEVKSEARW